MNSVRFEFDKVQSNPHILYGVIVAGGKNQRMGTIKGLLDIQGEPLLLRIIREMRLVCSQIIVVTNQYDQYNTILDTDIILLEDISPFLGPMSGFHTALSFVNQLYEQESCSHIFSYPYYWVVGSDMPFISSEFAKWLIKMLVQIVPEPEAIVPIDDGYYQPLQSIYSHRCYRTVDKLIKQGNGGFKTLLKEIEVKYLNEELIMENNFSRNIFTNMNTREDYLQILSKIIQGEV